MPTQYNLPEYSQAQSIQDVNLYNKLPFYLATMSSKRQQIWNTYDKLFGKVPWQANMGSIMKGVEAVYTPIGRMQFFPQPLTELANKDVFTALERTEQAVVQHHKFESQQLNFLPSFQDFRENQVDFQLDDIERQKGVANDQFIRTVILQKSPFVIIPGNTAPDAVALGYGDLSEAPYIAAGTNITAATVAIAGKNDAFLALATSKIGRPGLGLFDLDKAVMILRDDLGVAFFENTQNTPKDNELIKGKYVVVGSAEAFQNLKWDPNMGNFRNVDWNIVVDGFYGSIFGLITYKIERYPIRIKADGTIPVPEIQTATFDTVVNPDYASAPFEVAFVCGADAYKSIKIGPPPKKFAGGSMSPNEFQGLNWNGEVRLTKNVLLKYADGTYDTNKYGEFVQLISYLVMGCLAVRPRNIVPIIFRRGRPGAI